MRGALGFVGLAVAAICGGACGGSSSAGEGSGGGGGSGGKSSGYSSSGTSGSSGASGDDGSSGSSGVDSSGSGGASSSASGSGGAASGSSSSSASDGSSGGGGTMPTTLPTVSGTCPTLGSANGSVLTFAGQQVTVWAGTKTSPPGPLVIYWYATGSSPSEATRGVDVPTIVAHGGVVAAQNATTKAGTNTGDGVWYTGDFAIADEVVACAIQQDYVDARRIHAAGYSAGGLQTAWMTFARSNYLASVITYSGGMTGTGGYDLDPAAATSEVAAAIVAHGVMDTGSCNTPLTTDCLGEDFYVESHAYEANIKMRGGFAVDCDDGGGHISTTRLSAIAPVSWTFFNDHPFMVRPEPWTALPTGFPSYCVIDQ